MTAGDLEALSLDHHQPEDLELRAAYESGGGRPMNQSEEAATNSALGEVAAAPPVACACT
jgi:hypothetical protein